MSGIKLTRKCPDAALSSDLFNVLNITFQDARTDSVLPVWRMQMPDRILWRTAKMNRKSLLKKNRCGAVLPLVVLIVLLLMIIGLGVAGLGLHSRLFAIRSAESITARSAADAAVSDAIFKMNEKLKVKPWNNSSLPAASDVALLNSDATYDYVVTEKDNIYSVEGTGKSLNHTHTINSTLRLISPFDYALLTRNTIELKNSGKVDWYNNRPGDWPLQVGTISTAAGDITLMNGSTINGDVIVGVGGDPTVVINGKSGAIITGATYPLTYVPPLPSVIVPDPVASMSAGAPITTSTTISASGKYSGINLGHNKVLTINKPVTIYITGDVLLGQGAAIDIISGGSASLNLYVGGTVDGGNSAGFNNTTADTKKLGIYCLDTCVKVVFKNSSSFYGTIYAPNAAVTIDNSADIYGSVVSNSFILKNSGIFFYDTNLRNRSLNDELVRFASHKWSEQ